MHRKNAFSLVELSIVLVILGLLTGGILTGQNLIRAAELRSVTTEFQTYQTAVMTFRDKYFALPGDMTNATDFWTAMTNCGAASPSGTGTQTCNGNGDGDIDQAGAASQTGEMFTFWQQLANAGLIEGSYSGIAASGGSNQTTVGTNTPGSKMGSAGWTVYNYAETDISSGNRYEGSYGNIFAFGVQASVFTSGETVSAVEAWGIDKKVDDGRPGLGKVRVWEHDGNATAGQGCGNAASSTSVALADSTDYDLANTSTSACALIFTPGF